MRIFIFLLIILANLVLNAQVLDIKREWTVAANGNIYDVIDDSVRNKKYFLGSFEEFGWNTGGVGLVDSSNFQLNKSFPAINGDVYSIISDGVGGWYVAGKFNTVGTVKRPGIARINNDGSIHPWNPSFSIGTGSINCLKLDGNKIWVGGYLTPKIFFNIDTSISATIQNPTIDLLGTVTSLDIVGNSLILAGSFNYYNGVSSYRTLLSFNKLNFALLWNGNITKSLGIPLVYKISIRNSIIYFSGSFSSVDGVSRNSIGAVNLSNGSLHSWYPNGYFGNNGIIASSFGIFLASNGTLNLVNGTTGSRVNWNQSIITGSTYCHSIYLINNTLFIAGGTTKNRFITSVSAVSGVSSNRSNRLVSGQGISMCISGNKLLVGGTFKGMDGIETDGLVEIDKISNLAKRMYDNGSSNVENFSKGYLIGNKLFILGYGISKKMSTYNLDSIGFTNEHNINIQGSINDIVADGQNLIGVGQISSINGFLAYNAFILNLQNNSIDLQTIRFNNNVNSIIKIGSKLFFSGEFTTINGINRNRIASMDWNSKTVNGFNPNPSDSVFCISNYYGNIIFSGKFGMVKDKYGNLVFRRIAIFDTLGNLLPQFSNFTSNGYIKGITTYGRYVYFIGDFSIFENKTANGGIAEYSIDKQTITSFSPSFCRTDFIVKNNYYPNKIKNCGNELIFFGIFHYQDAPNSTFPIFWSMAQFSLQTPIEIETVLADSIRSTFVQFGGLVKSPTNITCKGVVVSTQSQQKWNGSNGQLANSNQSGTFFLRFNGLSPQQKYFYKVFAIIGQDTLYGDEKELTTTATGNYFDDPISISLPYSGNILTSASGFSNSFYGPNNQPSQDVFFKFTTSNYADTIQVSTCSSNFDTYLHLLDSTGNRLGSNSQDGPICAGNKASIIYKISPNTTYFLVLEGDGNAAGNAQLNVVSKIFYLWDPLAGVGPKHWSDPRNWAPGTAPLPGFSIVLPGSGSDSVLVDQDVLVGNVVFQGSNQNLVLNQNNLTVLGNILNPQQNNYFVTRGDGTVKVMIPPGLEVQVPVGESTINTLSIQNNTGVLDSFEIRVDDAVLHRGTIGVPLNQPKVNRTWHINKGSGHSNLGNGVRMKFFVPTQQWPSTISNLGLFHYNNNLGWELVQNGTYSKMGDTVEILMYKGSFSPFYWGDQGNALPVTLVKFEVNCETKQAEIQWETLQEINASHYEVWYSVDGKQWDLKFITPSKSNGSHPNYYSQNGLVEKKGFVKLIQIDLDGTRNVLGIQPIRCNLDESTSTIQIFPNPSSEFISFFPTFSKGTWKLTNNLGVELKNGYWNSLEKIQIQVLDFKEGCYHLIIEQNESISFLKWIKAK